MALDTVDRLGEIGGRIIGLVGYGEVPRRLAPRSSGTPMMRMVRLAVVVIACVRLRERDSITKCPQAEPAAASKKAGRRRPVCGRGASGV